MVVCLCLKRAAHDSASIGKCLQGIGRESVTASSDLLRLACHVRAARGKFKHCLGPVYCRAGC